MDFRAGGSSQPLPAIGAAIPHKAAVTSLSYHNDGVHLFAATEADSRLYLINSLTGKCNQAAIKCEREGVNLVSSTHHDHCVLLAGSGSPELPSSQKNSIQYVSMYDNKVLRKFRGHTDAITEISMSPADDMFLTSSKDRTVRLWDVGQAGCVAQMELPANAEGTPHAVFDSTGLVFAVTAAMAGGEGNYIHLYDARNYAGGAFSEMRVSSKDLLQAIQTQRVDVPPGPISWNTVRFNTSGNRMLVEADPGIAVVLDGFEGTVQRVFVPPEQGGKIPKQTIARFTPDDESVVVGTDDGTINCWNIQTGTMIKTLQGHKGPVGALACNPKYAQIASACTNTCLWIW